MIKSLKYDNPQFQVEVEWMITQRCNYTCSYCASYDNTQPFLFKSLEEYFEAFKYLSDYFGNKTIKLHFLGGEPTLFKQWVKLVNWLADYNYKPIITTNLSIPAIQYIRVLNPKLDKFINASFHTEFADLDSFYESAKLLNNAGFLHSIGLLPHPDNWEYSMKCYEKLKEVAFVNISKIKDEKSTNSISSGFIEYSKDQLKLFDEKPKLTDEHLKLEVDDKIINPSIYEIREKYSNFKGMKCAVGRDRLHIKPSGDVFPSACLLNYEKANMGNIYKQNIVKAKNAITCPFNECLCGPDIRIEKWAQV